MTPSDIKKLIKEEVAKVQLQEALVNLEHLHDNVSSSTMIGRPWLQLISSLEAVIDEVNSFNSSYSSGLHGPMPNSSAAIEKLQQVIRLLSEIKPIILGMDDIQKKDV